jgi:Fe-S cluster biogenesis protein NfuA
MTEKNRTEQKVLKALDRIRPYLQNDGGDIEFVELTADNQVVVKLTGACHGCPFAMQTLKAGVEQAVIQEVPEIKGVVSA